MNFDDSLSLIAAIITLVLLIVLSFKIFTSCRTIALKISFFLLSLFLALPFWYLLQFAVISTLALVIPQNKIITCMYLNEKNCVKRSDCGLIYPMGGLGKEMKPMCINKNPQE
jgi:glucan phosphoethanolaminetransferase (alkaline phosphatase superfamily)